MNYPFTEPHILKQKDELNLKIRTWDQFKVPLETDQGRVSELKLCLINWFSRSHNKEQNAFSVFSLRTGTTEILQRGTYSFANSAWHGNNMCNYTEKEAKLSKV